MHFVIYFLGIALLNAELFSAKLSPIQSGANLTEFVNLRRQKRTLIFEGSGLVKIDAGAIATVNVDEPIAWRSIVSINNIQGGFYPLPAVPTYPWDKWEDTFARSMKHFQELADFETDDSRLFIYTLLEVLMERQHGNGHQCLLRSICQNAQVDEHVGMFSEIMDVVLRPGKESIAVAYTDAFVAGKANADCMRLYSECRVPSNYLDQYLDYV
ncbi:uncharacterized protein LOC126761760 isoform X1 [Bactrocera neohumeralis]|uniref:uncharacterized protein LOC120778186 isoform X1 n=1 Tax=Bactrocera tryoni TaxID=59916 RepID=UPI001A988A5E|nr:uncharacterized protein LOC120778186 isoform X1 [Bactrocera tryoni]XP_050334097.1 uncharacterized protein LOC126761760 isoform X1 [Bactrocera neohumeralis]